MTYSISHRIKKYIRRMSTNGTLFEKAEEVPW